MDADNLLVLCVDRQHQALNQVTYSCLKETCYGTEHCHIQEKDGTILSSCRHYEPTSPEMCSNHDDVTLPNGCYCNDVQCVQNIATDNSHEHITVPTLAPEYLCDKASCRSDMFCQLITYQGVAISRCLAIHIGENCVSYKDVDEGGCICNNANCATHFLAEYSLNHPATPKTYTKPPTPSTPSTTLSMKTPTTPAITISPTTPPTTKTPTTPSTLTTTTTTPTKTPTTTTPTLTPTTDPTTTPTTTTPSTTTLNSTTFSTTTPSTTTPTRTTLTTTSKTMPTTTSTITTTTIPTTTTTMTGPRTCHICGDTSLPVPCSSRQIGRDLSHTCKTGENYCMTDIVHDDQGNVDVFKRCVDLAT